MHKLPKNICIIGAGWAGLTAAYYLTKQGFKVSILEAAPQAGGRARAIQVDSQYKLDNGQHMLISGYHHTIKILKELHQDIHNVLLDSGFNMHILDKQNNNFNFKIPNLVFPFNFIASIIKLRHFNFIEKFHLSKFFFKVLSNKINFNNHADTTVLELLYKHKLSNRVIEILFEPIVISAMTTKINAASAKVFVNILKITFNNKNYHWLTPTVDLSALFVTPITNYLIKNNTTIHYLETAQNIKLLPNNSFMISTKNNNFIADFIIAATQAWQTAKLIKDLPQLHEVYTKLSSITYQPIITIYLIFAQKIMLDFDIQGLIGKNAHWIFNKAFSTAENILAIVVSSSVEFANMPKDIAIEHIKQEILLLHKELPPILDIKLIHEKRAAFTCSPQNNRFRVTATTDIRNLILAGDHILSDYPATLESAVISGIDAAKTLLTVMDHHK